jgi:hypothetical protein
MTNSSNTFSVEENPATAPDELAPTELLVDAPIQAPTEPFTIDTESKANWLVRKIIELRLYRDRVDEWADREKARTIHDENFLMMRYGAQLQSWALAQIDAFKGRRKSLCLPAGTVGFRHQAPRLVVTDSAKVIAWAREHCPTAVQLTEKLILTPLHEHLAQSGEVPAEGAEIQPAKEVFFVR